LHGFVSGLQEEGERRVEAAVLLFSTTSRA